MTENLQPNFLKGLVGHSITNNSKQINEKAINHSLCTGCLCGVWITWGLKLGVQDKAIICWFGFAAIGVGNIIALYAEED